MDSDKSKSDVTINVSTADIELGIANVIVAFQRCGAIDMHQFLGALEQTTSQTHGREGMANKTDLNFFSR